MYADSSINQQQQEINNGDPIQSFLSGSSSRKPKLSLSALINAHARLSMMQMRKGNVSYEDIIQTLRLCLDGKTNDYGDKLEDDIDAYGGLLYAVVLTPVFRSGSSASNQFLLQMKQDLLGNESAFIHTILKAIRDRTTAENPVVIAFEKDASNYLTSIGLTLETGETNNNNNNNKPPMIAQIPAVGVAEAAVVTPPERPERPHMFHKRNSCANIQVISEKPPVVPTANPVTTTSMMMSATVPPPPERITVFERTHSNSTISTITTEKSPPVPVPNLPPRPFVFEKQHTNTSTISAITEEEEYMPRSSSPFEMEESGIMANRSSVTSPIPGDPLDTNNSTANNSNSNDLNITDSNNNSNETNANDITGNEDGTGDSTSRHDPVSQFLSQIRRYGMVVLLPQQLHDQILTCFYVVLKILDRPMAHRDLTQILLDVKDSGHVPDLQALSATKIRGVLQLLKQSNVISSKVNGDSTRLSLSKEISHFVQFRQRHDQFILAYMIKHHVHVPEEYKYELVWEFADKVVYHQYIESLERRIAELMVAFEYIPIKYPAPPPTVSSGVSVISSTTTISSQGSSLHSLAYGLSGLSVNSTNNNAASSTTAYSSPYVSSQSNRTPAATAPLTTYNGLPYGSMPTTSAYAPAAYQAALENRYNTMSTSHTTSSAALPYRIPNTAPPPQQQTSAYYPQTQQQQPQGSTGRSYANPVPPPAYKTSVSTYYPGQVTPRYYPGMSPYDQPSSYDSYEQYDPYNPAASGPPQQQPPSRGYPPESAYHSHYQQGPPPSSQPPAASPYPYSSYDHRYNPAPSHHEHEYSPTNAYTHHPESMYDHTPPPPSSQQPYHQHYNHHNYSGGPSPPGAAPGPEYGYDTYEQTSSSYGYPPSSNNSTSPNSYYSSPYATISDTNTTNHNHTNHNNNNNNISRVIGKDSITSIGNSSHIPSSPPLLTVPPSHLNMMINIPPPTTTKSTISPSGRIMEDPLALPPVSSSSSSAFF